MMRDNLLAPITGVLIISEALQKGKYGHMPPGQCESLDVIHNCAVDMYRRTMHIMEDFENGLAFDSPHIGHDWLTPAANIISYSDFLMMNYDGELQPRQHEKVSWVFYRTHFLRRQVFNVLNFRHIKQGEKKPFKAFDLMEVFDKNMIIIENASPVIWQLPDTLPRVYNHHRYLSQTLSNLLVNAQKITAPEDDIVVSVHQVADMIEVSIQDKGTGVPPEYQGQIFDPYFKVKSHSPGIGIGLYIACIFIKWQGGDLIAHYTPDDGTTFSFTIPLHTPDCI